MYESISDTFGQCGVFFCVGIVFGLIYEALRFFRQLISHNTVAVCIEDSVFFSISAFVTYTTSLMVGTGYFRIYYVVCEGIGGILYFLTLGRLLQKIFKKVAKFIRRIIKAVLIKSGKSLRHVAHKIRPKIVKAYEITEKVLKKGLSRLPKPRKILYNNHYKSDTSDIKKEAEHRNVIKAEIRKKA